MSHICVCIGRQKVSQMCVFRASECVTECVTRGVRISYGVAMTRRLLEIIGLFCNIKKMIFCKRDI